MGHTIHVIHVTMLVMQKEVGLKACLRGLSAFKWVQVCNPKRAPKSYPKKEGKKPKSKLELPKVKIRGQIIPQPKSSRWLRKDRLHEY